MNPIDKQLRALLAHQASEWFVLDDAESLDPREARELLDWLTQSREHVAEFLAVAELARDLKTMRLDESALQSLVARARADQGEPVRELEPGSLAAPIEERAIFSRRLIAVGAALAFLSLGLTTWGVLAWMQRPSLGAEVVEAQVRTRHGEQRTVQLADHSRLHLNTDTSVIIRYTASERFVRLEAGEAAFEIMHESNRAFRVAAGAAEVVDSGTSFDVRLTARSTVVTVIEGQVDVQATYPGAPLPSSPQRLPAVHLDANQQIVVADDQPLTPVIVDAQHETAWMRRQIEFENEPLEQVAAEVNRYAVRPVVITSARLRALPVSGLLSIDDSEELIAFLRSLEGVQVEVTAHEIRVSKK